MTRYALRWVLVPLAAWLAWTLTLLIGWGLLSIADALCPEDQKVSGMCIAPWYDPVTRALFVLCAALAAAGVVLASAWAAPSHRRWVAWVALVLGAVWATRVAGRESWVELLAAIVAGALAAMWVHRSTSATTHGARRSAT